jgi:PAS domain S-box-containing protein
MPRQRRSTPSDTTDDVALLVKQSLRYADDLAQIYSEEKAKRQELEQVNEKLRLEIDQRRRAEDGLRESEERFRAIFDTAPDLIYIKDKSLAYTHVNPAMESLFHMSGPELLGKDDRALYGIEAGRHIERIDRRVLGGECIEEETTRSVKGVPITFLEARVPLRNAAGEIIGLCGIARNITDRRRVTSDFVETLPEYPSKTMQTTLTRARLIAAQDSTVLLLGESGSGKDYLASFIHDNSERRNGPFFAVNCASVAPELAESELFGHEQGAFTGARQRKRGLLELAEGGTLFLNEIGELPVTLQAKLLTFLDTKSFTRVGGERSISVNTRLITATNRDLEEEVRERRFRQDLLYRLNVFSIRIPPLRDRREDIPVLTRQLVAQLEKDIRLSSRPVFGKDLLDVLKAHDWPGNVRELRNCLERALILSGGGKITLVHLGLEKTETEWTFHARFPENRTLNDVTRDLKRALVEEALDRAGRNTVRAAKLLGISRNSLNHYIASLDIDRHTD